MSKQMYVITVAPIVRAASRTLSYFSPIPYPVGSIVKAPVRKHAEHNVLVLKSRAATSLKSELRSADYTLRKLPEQSPRFITHTTFIEALSRVADYGATSIGALLQTTLPQASFEITDDSIPELESGENFSYKYIQDLPDARHEFFRNHVRSSFARKKSVFLVAPTQEKVRFLKDALSRGIEKHTFLLHGGLSSKKQQSIWKDAQEHPRSVLIIATPHFLSLPRKDIGTIIIEDEGSDLYESKERPYLDFRTLAREYARAGVLTCIAADTLVRTETYAQAEPLQESRLLYPSSATCRIIDMGKYNEDTKGFEMLSPQTCSALEKADTEKVLLYVTRRGSYPLTQCNDCGTIVKCEKCNYPLVLYEKAGKNIYRCHMCNRTYDTHIRCHKCHGWRLSLYGIALDRVCAYVEENYPDIPVFSLGSSAKKNRETVDEFEKARGGVLVTLKSGLPFIHKQVDTVSVISIDPLFAIPDISVSENIARLLLELRAKASKRFLIQVRNTKEDVLTYASSGDTKAFFEHELKEREQFKLPPHYVFIKMRWSGRYAESIRAKIPELFGDYSPDIYSSFYRTKNGGRIYNALISLPQEKWPDAELKERLSALPRSVGVNVDPVSIL